MFKTIIWATDGSEAADRALPHARALAESGKGSLVVLHCKELLVGRGGGYPVYVDEDEVAEKVRGQADELRSTGLDVTLQLASSAASGVAHTIADVARGLGGDVIVVGTRGHAPTVGLLLGSVTQRLLHIAPCPVLAVPPHELAELAVPDREVAEVAH